MLALLPAAARADSSTQCPAPPAGTPPHADAQRAGQIFASWHTELVGSIGEQYSGHGLDNVHGAWFVGYAPGPLDEAAVRARVLEVVDRHVSGEEAAFMREHLLLDPQRYGEAELRDVQRQLGETAHDAPWAIGVSCMYGDIRRAEVTLWAEDSTPEQQEEARRAAARFGDRAVVGVEPGHGPRPTAGPSPTCPLVAPVPPPAEGRRGFVFVAQTCRLGQGVETDYDVVTDFGDGTREATPFRPDGLWLAGGDHVYRRAGRYEVATTVTDRRTGEATVLRRTVEIANARLRVRKVVPPSFPAGRAARRVVAAFSDENPFAGPGDFRVTVRWGDGTRSAGRVRRAGKGRFEVVGRHRYARGALPRRISVRIADRAGGVLRPRTRALSPAGAR